MENLELGAKIFDELFENALLHGTGFIKYTINEGFSVVKADDYKYIPKEWMGGKVELK
jgi:hypothetical protein